MKNTSLRELRRRVRDMDRKLTSLLNERARIAVEIGMVKAAEGSEVYDPHQERRVYEQICTINEGPLSESSLRHIFREIISASRSLQQPLTIAYLGPEASFSHLAAQSHFGGSVSFSAQPSIVDVFDRVERGQAHYGVVPVENSLEGRVNLTLDRLLTTPLKIRAEIILPIRHCLMASGIPRDRIVRVYSHPQALAQCQMWLRKHLPACSLHAVESTAFAAQTARKDPEGAAIGSREAAAMYELNVIDEGIEDHSSNATRFLVIGEEGAGHTGGEKTSIVFGTRHEPGALHRALESFAKRGINLVRIESYPLKGSLWEYLFFVDFTGSEDDERIGQCLTELRERTTFYRHLGSYPKGAERQ